MATKTKEVGLRLSVKDKEIAQRALTEFGAEGQAVLKKIERASAPVSGSLLAIDRSVRVARDGWRDWTRGAIATLIPTFSAVAAINGAKAALEEFGKVADDSKAAGLDTELFQGIGYQAKLMGVEINEVSSALNTFNKNSGLAAENKGRMVTQLKVLNPELLRNIQLATTQEERVRLVADAIARATSSSEKAAIATAAFGDAGARLAPVFEGGAAAIDETMKKARELGIIVDRELIARADELGDEFDTASQVMGLKFKQLLIDLTPLLISVANLLGSVADAIKTIREAGQPLAAQSTGFLQGQLKVLEEIKKRADENGGLSAMQWLRGGAKERYEAIVSELKSREGRIDITVPGGGGGGGELPPDNEEAKRLLREAEQLIKRVRSAAEAYDVTVGELNAHLAAGRITQEQYQRALGDAAVDYAKAADGSAEYAAAEARLRESLAAGTVTQQEFNKALDEMTRKRLEAANTWEAGIQLGLMRIAESERNFGKDIGDDLVRGVERFEDAWISAIETGKFEWGDFAKQILLDIARMSTRQLITGPISNFLSNLFGGGAGASPSFASNFANAVLHRAGGGQARRGARIIGGENKPELFIPDENGTIIPGLHGAGGTIVFQQTNYIDGASGSPEQLRAVMDAHGRQLLAQVPAVVKKAQADGVFG